MDSSASAPPTTEPHDRADAEVLVELRGVGKRYGSLHANDDISLTVRAGEVHVLVGENGAGKSTLMGILSGTVQPDSGSVVVCGADITGGDARTAISHGVGMVHQHFRLVGAFTAAENIALGDEPRGRSRGFDKRAASLRAREVSERFGLQLDPDAVVDDMSVGMQQRVEIVKTLTRDARVLIFDEPTAVLTEEEAAALTDVLRRLRDDGRAILFITHKLREALAIADTVSVLRRGRLIATLRPEETSVAELGTLMVGRAVVGTQRSTPARDFDEASPVRLAARSASLASRTLHGVTLRDLDIAVTSGEVLAVLGVDGNGQQEVFALLTGQFPPDSGRLELDGNDVTGADPGALLGAGLGVVPPDRHAEGLVLPMSIARNLILDRRDEPRFTALGGLLVRERAVNEHARDMVETYDIRAQSIRQPVGSLSGGNQQKVVLARELERDLVALVAANPTRGLDIGSIEFVHRQLLALAERGRGVVVITSDLDEAMAVADRIAVLYEGSVVGTVPRPFNRHQLGILMGGTA